MAAATILLIHGAYQGGWIWTRVAARLRAAGIAVRPAASFPGLTADDLRITARDPHGNERLAAALAAAVAA